LLPQHLGTPVRCGQCGKVFKSAIANSPSKSSETAPPTAGFWHGLKGLVRSLKPAQAVIRPADDDVALEFDAISRPAPGLQPPEDLRLEIGSATSLGKVRQRNEDSFLVQHWTSSQFGRRTEAALIVVADGMGGEKSGDKASALTFREIATVLGPLLLRDLGPQSPTSAEWQAAIDAALREANEAVYREAQAAPDCKGMGATAVVAVVHGEDVQISLVGDCRAYHFSGGRLSQITSDQTLVARMVELGQLSLEEARTHPQRNEVTQAIGRHVDLQPARYQIRLQAGEWLLLACDGLEANLDRAALTAAVAAAPDAEGLARHLIDLANDSGGSDNCTVVAVRL
jgi:protein phosphatase